MLKIFDTYRNYLFLILGVLYSIALWHVATKYESSNWLSEKVAVMAHADEVHAENTKLANSIGKVLDDKLSKMSTTQTVINRKIEREIIEKPVYTDCVTTPVGVQLIEDAIRNTGQPTSK